MKILSVNAGSSSLKFQMYEMPEETVLISGVFERIGLDNSFYTIKINGEKIKKDATLSSHEDAVNILIKELLENKVIESLDEIKGVGHRIVHGADKYSKSLVLNEEILDEFCRVMKRINIYIWCSKAQIKKYLDYFLAKTNLYEILIWHKTNPVPTINGTYLCD